MQISIEQSSKSLSLSSQWFEITVPAAEPAQTEAPKDQVTISDQALAASAEAAGEGAESSNPTWQLLHDMLGLITGREAGEVSLLPSGEVSADTTEAVLSGESVSLAVSGTLNTKDGKTIGFSLDLSYQHAELSAASAGFKAGEGGISLSFAGVAAELTSTRFSFSLTPDGDQGPVEGKGALHLDDEVSKVAKEVKPWAKEFMEASGLHGGWGKVNRFLRSLS
ncbi:hypothetical protein GPEL0_01r2934 [Geoanaerobacter pelophilus]|uniref:AsmA-like C-terminal domain-containing protein n=1 Tax=Geoanaerobacter pelophilus TaxID=60036 RepID=A0ABQ0MJG4_9BACT|nr:hypothetical protein [Geoanaerobacter pelophilus]GAW67222.1 hypothetical protein GPEL0_01r2934 [Geoanaerobacter pelophilus]